MSTSHSDVLCLRPYAEIDTVVPELPVQALPGRLAALTHPLNKGRLIHLPDREWHDPDLCLVTSSGIKGFDPGTVVLLAPDHGTYYPGFDERELRIVGVTKPWWESVLGIWTEEGLAPAPGWMLVDREPHPDRQLEQEIGGFVLPDSAPRWHDIGTVLASCGDNYESVHEGERTSVAGLRAYTFDSEVPKSWCIVRAPIASKRWLTNLATDLLRAS